MPGLSQESCDEVKAYAENFTTLTHYLLAFSTCSSALLLLSANDVTLPATIITPYHCSRSADDASGDKTLTHGLLTNDASMNELSASMDGTSAEGASTDEESADGASIDE